MAKATLKAKFESLTKATRGATVLSRMDDKGRKAFFEIVGYYAEAQHRPSLDELERLIEQETGVKVSRLTFSRYVREHEQTKK